MLRLSVDERRARVVRRHLLAPQVRAADPVAVTRALAVLHATDAVTVYLAVQARTEGVSVADVERALYEERTLIRILCMRRTLFVVPRDLAAVVQAACTRSIAARERRRLEGFVRDSEVSKRPAAWVTRAQKAALAAVVARGEASTTELNAEVPLLATRLRLGANTKWEATQSAGARILWQLAAEGRLMRGRPRGSWVNGQFRWTPTESWLGEPLPELDGDAARAELLRRYLDRFGPATETDVRWWTGWTAKEARAALAAVPHEAVDLDGATGLVLAGDLEPTDRPEPWAALLPTLDPTTMGWKEREWYLGPHAATLFDRNGNAGPTVWWDGRVVGGWSQRRDGEIVFKLLEDVGADTTRAVEVEAARVAGWLGEARFSPGFLPPFQKGLAA